MNKQLTAKSFDDAIDLLREYDMSGEECPRCGCADIDIASLCGDADGAKYFFVCHECGATITKQEKGKP